MKHSFKVSTCEYLYRGRLKAVGATDHLASWDFKPKGMCRHFYCKQKKYWDLEVTFKRVQETIKFRCGLFIYWKIPFFLTSHQLGVELYLSNIYYNFDERQNVVFFSSDRFKMELYGFNIEWYQLLLSGIIAVFNNVWILLEKRGNRMFYLQLLLSALHSYTDECVKCAAIPFISHRVCE